MAEKDGREGDRLRQFLAKADLEQFLEPLKCLGAGKIAHLQDMRACDFDEIGMSGLEQARLKRILKEESKWRWARLGEKVLRNRGIWRPATTMPIDEVGGFSGWKPQKPSWVISPQSVYKERLSHGAAGTPGCVYEGIYRQNGEEIVVVDLLQLDESCSDQRDFKKETALMSSLNHTDVQRFYGVVLSDKQALLVSECFPRGTLSDELQLRGSSFLLVKLLKLADQVASGMKYLESKGVIHGDLRAANVLMVSPEKCKVGNFSLARPMAMICRDEDVDDMNRASVEFRLSFRWAAPEVIKSQQVSHAGDVWSYGCLLWEILSHGAVPWAGKNAVQILSNIDVPCKQRLMRPSHCPPDLHALMHKCWSHDPKERPLFAAIDSLMKECHPLQCTVVEECLGHPEELLPLEVGDLVTIVEKRNGMYWYGQNSDGQYGEFLASSVVISKQNSSSCDRAPGRSNQDSPVARSQRSSRASTGGDPDISQPYDIKKMPIEPDIQRLIEELTGLKVNDQSIAHVLAANQVSATARKLTASVSSPLTSPLNALTSCQRSDPGSRSQTPDVLITRRLGMPPSPHQQTMNQHGPELYKLQLSLVRPERFPPFKIDSPILPPHLRRVPDASIRPNPNHGMYTPKRSPLQPVTSTSQLTTTSPFGVADTKSPQVCPRQPNSSSSHEGVFQFPVTSKKFVVRHQATGPLEQVEYEVMNFHAPPPELSDVKEDHVDDDSGYSTSGPNSACYCLVDSPSSEGSRSRADSQSTGKDAHRPQQIEESDYDYIPPRRYIYEDVRPLRVDNHQQHHLQPGNYEEPHYRRPRHPIPVSPGNKPQVSRTASQPTASSRKVQSHLTATTNMSAANTVNSLAAAAIAAMAASTSTCATAMANTPCPSAKVNSLRASGRRLPPIPTETATAREAKDTQGNRSACLSISSNGSDQSTKSMSATAKTAELIQRGWQRIKRNKLTAQMSPPLPQIRVPASNAIGHLLLARQRSSPGRAPQLPDLNTSEPASFPLYKTSSTPNLLDDNDA